MGHIFISYSRKDQEFVDKLVQALESRGFDVWYDLEMLTGDAWVRQINKRIDECDAFVIVMSSNSDASEWVHREILYAMQENKRIFPLLLQGKLWMLLQNTNYARVVNGYPEQKFFNSIERFVPKNADWLAAEKKRKEQEDGKREETARAERDRIVREAEKRRIAKLERDRMTHQQAQERQQAWAETIRKTIKPLFTGIGILAAVFALIWIGNSIYEDMPALPTATQTLPALPTTTLPLPIPTIVFPENPNIGSFIESDGVTMMYVPAGAFTMGSDKQSDEQPIHSVTLDAYWIDKFEVTNAAYKRCVDAGVCDPPKQSNSNTHSAYYSNPEFDEYPVIYVDWNMVKTYCSWRDARLPTEAEWEKAARGTDDRTYPWGEEINCDKANYWGKNGGCVGDTTKVGSYLDGVSYYGLYDMAGNVWEWTSSLYKPYPYTRNDGREDPLSSDSRALRGGSWDNLGGDVRSAYRGFNVPDDINGNVGFRCSRSAK